MIFSKSLSISGGAALRNLSRETTCFLILLVKFQYQVTLMQSMNCFSQPALKIKCVSCFAISRGGPLKLGRSIAAYTDFKKSFEIIEVRKCDISELKHVLFQKNFEVIFMARLHEI